MVAVNYDWDELEDNIDEEYDDAGSTIAEYTTEPALFGNVISQRRGGQSSFLHCDGLGSTLALTNATGAVTDTNSYTAFGEVTEHAGSTVNPFQYVGQKGYYRDVDGLLDVRHRQYESHTSRWLSVDPLAWGYLLQGGSPAANPYAYVLSSPLMYSDPLGLWVNRGNNVYRAQTRDTFESLVKRVAPKLAVGNKVCIKPVEPNPQNAERKAEMAAEWECQRPAVCGEYDVSNLVDALPVGAKIVAAIGNDSNGYIPGATAFYRARPMSPMVLLETIATNAQEGRTPIKQVILIGHGQKRKDRLGGDGSRVPGGDTFLTLDLGDVDKWPTFEDALAGKHPKLCWFRTDASIRLVGCDTQSFAIHLAKALRGTAETYGTLRPTWSIDVNTMGWGKRKGGVIVRDPDEGTANSPEVYHGMKHWKTNEASYKGAGTGKVPARCNK